MSARKYDTKKQSQANDFDRLKQVVIKDLEARNLKANKYSYTLESHLMGFVDFNKVLNEWMTGQTPIESAGHYVLSGGRMTYDLNKVINGLSQLYSQRIELAMLPDFVERKKDMVSYLKSNGYQNVIQANDIIRPYLESENTGFGLTLKEISSVVRKRFSRRAKPINLALHD